jgi:hypothetical protein
MNGLRLNEIKEFARFAKNTLLLLLTVQWLLVLELVVE